MNINDKLRGRITEKDYDRFYASMREKLTGITVLLEQLQEAEDNYYFTAKYVLELINRAYELFVSSEVEEKRQLIKLILSNVRLEDENVVWDVQKPFDLFINATDSNQWRQTLGTLRTFRWSSLKPQLQLSRITTTR